MESVMNYFVNNVSNAIYNQLLFVDVDLISKIREVVRENIYDFPLFTHDLTINDTFMLRNMFNNFVDRCLDDVLRIIC